MPVSEPEIAFSFNLTETGFLIFAGLNTFVAYGCFAEALNLWDASRVSAVIALAPIFTIIFTKIILSGELLDLGANPDITLVQGLAAAGVVVGSIMVSLGNRETVEDEVHIEEAKLNLPD